MNKRIAHKMAKERVINALRGDVQIGGYPAYLAEKGYSEAEILLAEEIYIALIHQLEVRFGKDENKTRS